VNYSFARAGQPVSSTGTAPANMWAVAQKLDWDREAAAQALAEP